MKEGRKEGGRGSPKIALVRRKEGRKAGKKEGRRGSPKIALVS